AEPLGLNRESLARVCSAFGRLNIHQPSSMNASSTSSACTRPKKWLEMLCRHIPNRFEHLVRYVGWYSTRCRGERARVAGSEVAPQIAAYTFEMSHRSAATIPTSRKIHCVVRLLIVV